MMGVDHLKNHIVAGLELAYHSIELVFGGGWLPVDMRYDQARLQSLQVGEGTGADRLHEDAGGMNRGDHFWRGYLHDDAEFGFTCAPTVVIIDLGLRIVEIREDLVAV